MVQEKKEMAALYLMLLLSPGPQATLQPKQTGTEPSRGSILRTESTLMDWDTGQ